MCVWSGHLLLVQHEDPRTGEWYWLLPGGGRERGETLAQAAVRETLEETGVRVRVLRRLRVRMGLGAAGYAIFLAEPGAPNAALAAVPSVDLAQEIYLRAAAWHAISGERPLGPLNPQYWEFLAPTLRRLAGGRPRPETRSRPSPGPVSRRRPSEGAIAVARSRA